MPPFRRLAPAPWVPKDYLFVHELDKGAYVTVYHALHRPSGQKVAIKKIKPFHHPKTCLRTLRELRFLRHFQHENIISILDVPKPPCFLSFNEIYLVQELMPADLHLVIQTRTLSDDHCQWFICQLLRGVKAIHSAGVLHRDLKPANLLVNDQCDLKICFGLARADTDQKTQCVATRWYRAPELMITFEEYTKAIDMWSVGCILAEMLSGKVLFPGTGYHHQLALIFRALGSPSMEDYQAIKSDRAKAYIGGLPQQGATPWKSTIPEATDHSLDLLTCLLTFTPDRRMTVEEALEHPYIMKWHDPDDEPTSEPVPSEEFSFSRIYPHLGMEKWKRMYLVSLTLIEVWAS